MSNGKPLLLENIEEELDPMFDPVLEKRYIKQKRGLVLLLGDKEVCTIHWTSAKLSATFHDRLLY